MKQMVRERMARARLNLKLMIDRSSIFSPGLWSRSIAPYMKFQGGRSFTDAFTSGSWSSSHHFLDPPPATCYSPWHVVLVVGGSSGLPTKQGTPVKFRDGPAAVTEIDEDGLSVAIVVVG